MTEHDYHKKKADKWWFQWLIEHILNIFFGYEGSDAYYYECADCRHIQTAEEMRLMFSSSSVKDVCEHSLGDWAVVNPATCEGQGVEGRTCSLCGEIVEARTFDELGHDHSVITTVQPTCAEKGYTLHECSRCDDYYATDFVVAN